MARTSKIVLSIDDESPILYLRGLLLESVGYKVLNAASGREGLELFDSQDVDIVLLDYYMPEMDGEAVAAEMKLRKPQVPIIMVSASVGLAEPLLRSVESFVCKGLGPEILLQEIAKLVSVRPKADTAKNAAVTG